MRGVCDGVSTRRGLVVRLDGEHWLKCGLEYCDRRCQLSVVVTKNGYSDWSKVAYPGTHLTLRVYKQVQLPPNCACLVKGGDC